MQVEDSELKVKRELMTKGKETDFESDASGMLQYKGRVCVPHDVELRKSILEGVTQE
ncbi:hypothetical protein Lalb_Chr03g0039801 [Lupinus albus]|uniref:Uncharacterized protein n=1 Tax=Lupinus albus TaxID=3870 RepID=A0A6A4QW30_LUPAL|nr:hypothetical protein Lalb_Chr03g0039801 [Lupinus albus]